ncbi:thioredoxin [Haloplanus natans]|uniref:thioredoxin n=1 Tax=Haloplanus natans TaxID=376171 RepID=UPI0006782BCC|nr:thioredoxin [Haloplanus natans]
MNDTDDIERIRAEKRERLERERDGADSAAAAPDEPIHVDGPDHLADLAATYDAVLVDFYADWCGPCQMLEPIVESLAASTPAAVAKVDIDANQELASQYGVRGVPTLLLFADGDAVERVVGVQSEEQLSDLIDGYV